MVSLGKLETSLELLIQFLVFSSPRDRVKVQWLRYGGGEVRLERLAGIVRLVKLSSVGLARFVRFV